MAKKLDREIFTCRHYDAGTCTNILIGGQCAAVPISECSSKAGWLRYMKDKKKCICLYPSECVYLKDATIRGNAPITCSFYGTSRCSYQTIKRMDAYARIMADLRRPSEFRKPLLYYIYAAIIGNMWLAFVLFVIGAAGVLIGGTMLGCLFGAQDADDIAFLVLLLLTVYVFGCFAYRTVMADYLSQYPEAQEILDRWGD